MLGMPWISGISSISGIPIRSGILRIQRIPIISLISKKSAMLRMSWIPFRDIMLLCYYANQGYKVYHQYKENKLRLKLCQAQV